MRKQTKLSLAQEIIDGCDREQAWPSPAIEEAAKGLFCDAVATKPGPKRESMLTSLVSFLDHILFEDVE
jgi:nitrous oxide reductase accessory protein NosL